MKLHMLWPSSVQGLTRHDWCFHLGSRGVCAQLEHCNACNQQKHYHLSLHPSSITFKRQVRRTNSKFHRIQGKDSERQLQPLDVLAINLCDSLQNSGPRSAGFKITQSSVQSFLPTFQDVSASSITDDQSSRIMQENSSIATQSGARKSFEDDHGLGAKHQHSARVKNTA